MVESARYWSSVSSPAALRGIASRNLVDHAANLLAFTEQVDVTAKGKPQMLAVINATGHGYVLINQ